MNDFEFFITFTTKGLAELKDGMKDLNSKMDGMTSKFSSVASKGDTFFDHFVLWGKKVAGLAMAIAGVGSAISSAFNVSDKIIKLNQVADSAGVAASKVEALSYALFPFAEGGDTIGMAGNLYKGFTGLKKNLMEHNVPEALKDAQLKGNFWIDPNASVEDMIYTVSDVLAKYAGMNDEYATGLRNSIAGAFGIDEKTMGLLQTGSANVRAMIAQGYKNNYLSGEDNLEMALLNKKARQDLKIAWEKLTMELIPTLTLLTEWMTKLLYAVQDLTGWFSDWLPKKIKDAWEEITNIFKGKDPKKQEEARQAQERTRNIATSAWEKINAGTATANDFIDAFGTLNTIYTMAGAGTADETRALTALGKAAQQMNFSAEENRMISAAYGAANARIQRDVRGFNWGEWLGKNDNKTVNQTNNVYFKEANMQSAKTATDFILNNAKIATSEF